MATTIPHPLGNAQAASRLIATALDQARIPYAKAGGVGPSLIVGASTRQPLPANVPEGIFRFTPSTASWSSSTVAESELPPLQLRFMRAFLIQKLWTPTYAAQLQKAGQLAGDDEKMAQNAGFLDTPSLLGDLRRRVLGGALPGRVDADANIPTFGGSIMKFAVLAVGAYVLIKLAPALAGMASKKVAA